MRLFFEKLKSFIVDNYAVNLHSPVFGLSRSLLAFGTLLTLLFNNVENFFYVSTENEPLNTLFYNSPYFKVNFFTLLGYENILIFKYIAIIILFFVIVGFFQKITSVLHWYICWSFMHMSSALDGGDQIATILSFLFIPICFLDYRSNHWQDYSLRELPSSKNIIASNIYFLMRLQTFGIYFHAAIGKFNNEEWANGTAIYYWFNNSVFGMPQLLSYFLNPIINSNIGVVVLTYGVLFFELLLALSLFMSLSYRKYIFPLAIFFHFSIIFVHGIFSFFFSMAALLIIYLLPVRTNINQIYKQ